MVDTQVRIINDHGEDVAQDGIEKGKIIVKGNGVMNDGSGNFTDDGWLYTGDIGTIDENGRIEVVEKKKDASVKTGEDVSTVEIESILREHPTIQETAVITVPDKKLGETLHAFIVLREGYTATEQDIIEFSKENLTNSKFHPTTIAFLDELPKTSSGKILKVQLEEYV